MRWPREDDDLGKLEKGRAAGKLFFLFVRAWRRAGMAEEGAGEGLGYNAVWRQGRRHGLEPEGGEEGGKHGEE